MRELKLGFDQYEISILLWDFSEFSEAVQQSEAPVICDVSEYFC